MRSPPPAPRPMHELALCRALLREVETLATERGARAVQTVTVRIGPLSGIEPALLRAAYPIACAGSRAAGSALEIESPPVRVRCLACEAETLAAPNRLACAACGATRTQLLGGNELVLASVDLVY